MSLAEYNKLTEKVIAAAIDVHRELGPGLLESVYQHCLCEELRIRGISFVPQAKLPIIYKENLLDKSFRIDILVEDKLVVELKAVEIILPVHEVQLVTYLKLSGHKLGLLINFNEPILKQGIRRRINGEL
ncbi:MAG: GxxExxY protein [Tenuifilaceae bacterium]|jgi:GxxExxY protein|nr:GxxExxY protein [Tenuifilaceae bacterium]